jgi:hypothetical protein
MMSLPSGAGRNQLLAALRPHDRGLVEPHLQRLLLKKGQVLHGPGSRIDFVYFPAGALISLLVSLPGGEAVETAAIGADGAVGVTAGICAAYAWSKSVVHITGAAWRISAANLQTAAKSSARIRELIIHCNAALLAQIQQTCACNTFHARHVLESSGCPPRHAQRHARWTARRGHHRDERARPDRH